MPEQDEVFVEKQEKSRITLQEQTVQSTYHIRLNEDINLPSHYSDELELLETVTEADTILIDISTAGGVLETAVLFNRAIRNCRGLVIGIIGPECSSAGSMIALSCHDWQVDETSELMIHTSSGGHVGKETDTYAGAIALRKKLKRLYTLVYSGFLSEDEIETVINGTPMHFDADEIVERLNKMKAFRNSMYGEENDESE